VARDLLVTKATGAHTLYTEGDLMATMKVVTGLAETYTAAQAAVQRIMACGHAGEDINMIATDSTRRRVAIDGITLTAAALVVGAVIGVTFGGLVPLVALVVNSLFPSAQLVQIAPIVAAGIGLGSGGAAGGLIGALLARRVPEQLAWTGTNGLQQSGFLIGVRAYSEDDAKMVRNIMVDAGVTRVSSKKAGILPAST
jgi:MFS family permease